MNRIRPTMNQPGIRLVLLMFLMGVITLHAETCPDGQFPLPDSLLCCMICPNGFYIGKNCSSGPKGEYYGVLCNPCRRCEDNGLRTVSECTLFSDTQCAVNEHVGSSSKLPQFTMYGCLSAAAAIVVLAAIISACYFRRAGKSGESYESSAGESFDLEDPEMI